MTHYYSQFWSTARGRPYALTSDYLKGAAKTQPLLYYSVSANLYNAVSLDFYCHAVLYIVKEFFAE